MISAVCPSTVIRTSPARHNGALSARLSAAWLRLAEAPLIGVKTLQAAARTLPKATTRAEGYVRGSSRRRRLFP
jgi:hypothetical protein